VNLIELQTRLRTALQTAAAELFQIELEQLVTEVPPRTELGDLAFPVAFELAKQIKQKTGEKRAPRMIAEVLKPALESIEEVSRVDVAGAGYLNVFFDRARLISDLSSTAETSLDASETSRKLMVEHTSINPNKAAHIGHVRNAVLGDPLVQIRQAAGNRVEIHIQLDNT